MTDTVLTIAQKIHALSDLEQLQLGELLARDYYVAYIAIGRPMEAELDAKHEAASDAIGRTSKTVDDIMGEIASAISILEDI